MNRQPSPNFQSSPLADPARPALGRVVGIVRSFTGLALQLLSLWTSESMGNHDSNVMGGADSVD